MKSGGGVEVLSRPISTRLGSSSTRNYGAPQVGPSPTLISNRLKMEVAPSQNFKMTITIDDINAANDQTIDFLESLINNNSDIYLKRELVGRKQNKEAVYNYSFNQPNGVRIDIKGSGNRDIVTNGVPPAGQGGSLESIAKRNMVSFGSERIVFRGSQRIGHQQNKTVREIFGVIKGIVEEKKKVAQMNQEIQAFRNNLTRITESVSYVDSIKGVQLDTFFGGMADKGNLELNTENSLDQKRVQEINERITKTREILERLRNIQESNSVDPIVQLAHKLLTDELTLLNVSVENANLELSGTGLVAVENVIRQINQRIQGFMPLISSNSSNVERLHTIVGAIDRIVGKLVGQKKEQDIRGTESAGYKLQKYAENILNVNAVMGLDGSSNRVTTFDDYVKKVENGADGVDGVDLDAKKYRDALIAMQFEPSKRVSDPNAISTSLTKTLKRFANSDRNELLLCNTEGSGKTQAVRVVLDPTGGSETAMKSILHHPELDITLAIADMMKAAQTSYPEDRRVQQVVRLAKLLDNAEAKKIFDTLSENIQEKVRAQLSRPDLQKINDAHIPQDIKSSKDVVKFIFINQYSTKEEITQQIRLIKNGILSPSAIIIDEMDFIVRRFPELVSDLRMVVTQAKIKFVGMSATMPLNEISGAITRLAVIQKLTLPDLNFRIDDLHKANRSPDAIQIALNGFIESVSTNRSIDSGTGDEIKRLCRDYIIGYKKAHLDALRLLSKCELGGDKNKVSSFYSTDPNQEATGIADVMMPEDAILRVATTRGLDEDGNPIRKAAILFPCDGLSNDYKKAKDRLLSIAQSSNGEFLGKDGKKVQRNIYVVIPDENGKHTCYDSNGKHVDGPSTNGVSLVLCAPRFDAGRGERQGYNEGDFGERAMCYGLYSDDIKSSQIDGRARDAKHEIDDVSDPYTLGKILAQCARERESDMTDAQKQSMNEITKSLMQEIQSTASKSQAEVLDHIRRQELNPHTSIYALNVLHAKRLLLDARKNSITDWEMQLSLTSRFLFDPVFGCVRHAIEAMHYNPCTDSDLACINYTKDILSEMMQHINQINKNLQSSMNVRSFAQGRDFDRLKSILSEMIEMSSELDIQDRKEVRRNDYQGHLSKPLAKVEHMDERSHDSRESKVGRNMRMYDQPGQYNQSHLQVSQPTGTDAIHHHQLLPRSDRYDTRGYNVNMEYPSQPQKSDRHVDQYQGVVERVHRGADVMQYQQPDLRYKPSHQYEYQQSRQEQELSPNQNERKRHHDGTSEMHQSNSRETRLYRDQEVLRNAPSSPKVMRTQFKGQWSDRNRQGDSHRYNPGSSYLGMR